MLSGDPTPEDLNEQELRRRRQRFEDALHTYQVPAVSGGVRWTSQRLHVCDYFKRLERAGKSSVIDSFTRTGVSKGVHRAGDALHDPILGFPLAIREMGFKEACRKWPRHMASDLVTPMSLPLPGTCLLKNDSWIVRMYSKRLLNFRSGVVSPLLGVLLTEIEVRWRLRADETAEVGLAMQRAHQSAGMICLIAGGLMLLVPHTPSMIVAFMASAMWHLVIAGSYYTRRHSAEIKITLQRATAVAIQRGEAIGTRVSEAALSSAQSIDPAPIGTAEVTTIKEHRTSGLAMGIAAAALVGVLLLDTK